MNIFGDAGLLNLLKDAKNIASKAQEQQKTLASKQVEAEAGAGLVKVVMNGNGDLINLHIDKSLFDPLDYEVLVDLIISAITAGKNKANELKMETMKEMAGGIDLSKLGIDLGNIM